MVFFPERRPIDILLVEDNPGDARLTMETLRDGKIHNTLNVATDGSEALDYLQKRGRFSGATTPDLILLDLNLPRKTGREVLAEIKADKSLHSIPVVVLTTSSEERDIKAVYDLQANCYIVKPVGLTEFTTIVKSIEDFWFEVVRLPARVRA
ncbi:MAG TPA: response regulator [Vicinamibacterales bacterium]|nr:response regulator [Vicinamibacterales bacterium]